MAQILKRGECGPTIPKAGKDTQQLELSCTFGETAKS